jgi:hypothetical protein
MLKEIESLVRERGSVSLRDLAVHFESEPEALELMAERLVRKGRIRRIDAACEHRGARCRWCAVACCGAREEGAAPEMVFFAPSAQSPGASPAKG